MKYRSTNGGELFSFREATLRGLAPDGGLFMPVEIAALDAEFFSELSELSLPELALQVASPYLAEDLSLEEIRHVIESSCTFDAPVVKLTESIASLELFHGPTFAFKDFGARFMASAIEAFQKNESKELTVLVATSGDTGGAVGHGFLNRSGIKVVILYPKGMVSPLQEKQLTTLGGNVSAIRVDGTFDDCQALVKNAFKDAEIRTRLQLTSANSINVARLIPQMFYYFLAAGRTEGSAPLIFSVPSGNFGNLTAGLMAKRMGLAVTKFIAATNANDVVPHYLRTGRYTPRASANTLASAMDVGAPSNYARIMALYGSTHSSVTSDIEGFSVSDDEIKASIGEIYDRFHYVCDPHGVIALRALLDFSQKHGEIRGVFLHTAHPAKFPETVEPIVHDALVVPSALLELLDRDGKAIDLPNSDSSLKEYLLLGIP